jgi:hypothetical protein
MASKAVRITYKPVGLVLGVGAGMAAGLIFKQVWKAVRNDDEAPDATDEGRGWAEILAAAALQGAIFSVVRAAVDRAGAAGVRKATGQWPD